MSVPSSSEEDRFQVLLVSREIPERDPDVSSIRNNLIDQYKRLVLHTPEAYTGNIYTDVLPPSASLSNWSAAATYTARDPVNNRTRWALQSLLLQYGIKYGYEELRTRVEGSTEFSYQIHKAAFRFANDVETIGRLPWALLTYFNVPSLGESIGDVIYAPEAFLTGIEAGFTQWALDPYSSPEGANISFETAYARIISQKYDLDGRTINWTIETTNPPTVFHPCLGTVWACVCYLKLEVG